MVEKNLTAQRIRIKQAPQLPGLTFRSFRGELDYPHMADIINTTNQADQIEYISTVEDIAHSYKHLRRSDIERDLLFAEIDGEPIGYGRCMWDKIHDETNYYTYSFFVHLHPDWRGKGIGKAMAAHLINRIEEITQNHPGDSPKFIQTMGSDTQLWWDAIVTRLGFEPVRYGISMTRPCSQPVEILPIPEGIEIRPVEDQMIRQIFHAAVEAAQDQWNFVEMDEKDFIAWQENPMFDPSLWLVAWEENEVVGSVMNFVNKEENENFHRERGYTEGISTRRPWRKKGIASALLTRSIKMFIDMGMQETALGVDTENPSGALNIYKSVGYTEHKRHIVYRKPLN